MLRDISCSFQNFQIAPFHPFQLLLHSCSSNLKEVCWLFILLFDFIHWHGTGGLPGKHLITCLWNSDMTRVTASLQFAGHCCDRDRKTHRGGIFSPACCCGQITQKPTAAAVGGIMPSPYGMAQRAFTSAALCIRALSTVLKVWLSALNWLRRNLTLAKIIKI